jgi:proline iminopeptidase
MTFADSVNEKKLNKSYEEIPNWNGGFASKAFTLKEYWQDFKPLTSAITIPVLYFFGTQDWSVGPKHYQGIRFVNLQLRSAVCGHMPFFEARDVLEKDIVEFLNKN